MTALVLVLALAAPAPAHAQAGRVNLNTAGAALLVTLPGVGKAIAGRIIESRTTDGPFKSINDLTRVRGIGVRTLEKLRSLIAVGEGDPTGVAGAVDARAPPSAASANAGSAKPANPAKPGPHTAASKAFVGSVNVNTATADELKALPGIGPKTASNVIMDRNARGPYRSIDELTRVKGIGQGKLSKIRPFVTVGDPLKSP